MKPDVDNPLKANHINSQIRKPELNISEIDKYRLSKKIENLLWNELKETFENIFKSEVEREAEVLMKKNNWEDLSSKKAQTKDGKNLLPRE